LSVSSHSITAVYSGDINFSGSTSVVFTQTVNQDTTTTVVTSDNTSPAFGQTVTFTATISANAPGSGDPAAIGSETVEFFDGATDLGPGTAPVTTAGVTTSTFATNSLSAGSHSITAVYSGDATFGGSTSVIFTQVVTPAATTTVLTSAVDNPSVFGESVKFTATVTSPGGTPTGNVIFTDGFMHTQLGISALDINGVATLTTSALMAGSHPITATYSGAGVHYQFYPYTWGAGPVPNGGAENAFDSFSPTVVGDFNPSGPTIFVTPVDIGTVGNNTGPSAAFGGNFPTNYGAKFVGVLNITTAGNYTFGTASDDGSMMYVDSIQVVSNNFFQGTTFRSGTPTISSIPLSAGAHAFTVLFAQGGGGQDLYVSYQGPDNGNTFGIIPNSALLGSSPNYGVSSASVTQTVNQDATTTVLTSLSPNPGVGGGTTNCNVTVTANSPGAGTPTGTVQILVDGVGVAAFLGTDILIGGKCMVSISTPAFGIHNVTVTYSGDTNFATSTSSGVSYFVEEPTTTTLVSDHPVSSFFGQQVTFTATVTDKLNPAQPASGMVLFSVGGLVQSVQTLDVNGQATFQTSTLPVGIGSNAPFPNPDYVSVSYVGNATFIGSSASVGQTVTQATTSTSIIADINPSFAGQSVTFTATVAAVAPGAGTPSGTVTFEDSGNPIGTGTLSGDVATFTTATLSAGTHDISAGYAGDTNFAGSGTGSFLFPDVSQVVKAAATTTTVTSAGNPSVFGESVTFTATVAAQSPGAGTPTGTVQFFDGASSISGSISLSGGSASFPTNLLSVTGPVPPGTAHSIIAVYSGDTNFVGSDSSGTPVLQEVDAADTTTTVTSSLNPSNIGNSVTLTATVVAKTPGSGVPGGTVTFNDGGTALAGGSGIALVSGQATFSFAYTTPGVHNLTVDFTDTDNNYNKSSSAILQQFVNDVAPTVTTAITAPASAPYNEGSPITVTATVTDPNTAESFMYSWTVLKNGKTYTSGTTSSAAGATTSDFTFTPDDNGSYSVLVTAIDSGGGSAIATPLSITVVNVAPSLSNLAITSPINEGGTATLTGNMSDPGTLDSLTLTVDWGDGSAAQNFSYAAGTTSFSVTHQYLDNGTFTPSVTLTDKDGGSIGFNPILNGGFETGDLTGWVVEGTNSTPFVSNSNPHSGQFAAVLGTPGTFGAEPSGDSSFYQQINVPPSGGTLSFWYLPSTTDSITFDWQDAYVTDTSDNILATIFHQCTTGPWTQQTFDMTPYAGTTVRIKFLVHQDGYGDLTSMFVDNVTIGVIAPSVQVNNVAPTATINGAPVTSLEGTTINLTSTVTDPSPVDTTAGFTFSWSVTKNGNPFGTNGTAPSYSFTPDAVVTSPDIYVVTLMATDKDGGVSAPATATISVTNVAPTVTITGAPAVSPVGAAITLNTTVSDPGAGDTFTYAWTITGSVSGSPILTNSSLTFTPTATGNYNVSVVVTDKAGATGTANVNIGITDTTSSLALTTSGSPSVFGQSVTFTATVSASTSGAPTGTVTFFDGATPVSIATVSTASGNQVTTFTTTALSVATHTITAQYSGDANFKPSSNSVSQEVDQADTTTAVVSSGVLVSDNDITLTATVSPVAPGAGTPTGTVTFKDGTTTLGTATLSGGSAAFTTDTLTVANNTHDITAVYSGDTNFNGSTSLILPIDIAPADTTTTVTVSPPSPSVWGQPVTFTATVVSVAPSVGVATNTVQFFDGITPIGNPITLVNGVATLTIPNSGLGIPPLSVGPHSIAAGYSGNIEYNASSSSPVSYEVDAASTTTTVTSDTNPASIGQSVTLTATIAAVAPGAGDPASLGGETVEFFDGGTSLGFGSGPSTSGGVTTSTLAVTFTTVGLHNITAQYVGDTDFNNSTSAVMQQFVSDAGTTTALVSSVNPSTVGQSVTFTATVSAATSGAPTGTVTFMDGATPLSIGTIATVGGNQVATFTTSALDAGAHQITAVYSGDANYLGSTSSVVTQTVDNLVPSSLVLSPAQAIVGSGAISILINGSNFAPGASASFNGLARPTEFVNASLVIMSLGVTDVGTLGVFPVTVSNTGTAGSAPANFTVENPSPVLVSITPDGAVEGDPAVKITVSGVNFVSGSTVHFGSTALTTTFVSSTSLLATIPASSLAAGTAGTVAVTVVNATPGGGTSNSATFTIGKFTVNSPPTATPNPAKIGQSVAFAVAASSSSNGALSFAWDFGDTTSGTGPNPTHTYNALGTYSATVTITVSTGAKITASVNVVVITPDIGGGALPPGTFTDTTGSGVPDEMLTVASTVGITSANSSQPLPNVKLAIKLNFGNAGNDTIALGAMLDNTAAGKPLVIDVGGVVKAFKLDSKGKARAGGDSVTVSLKTGKLAVKFSKGSFAATLASSGFTNATVSGKSLNVRVGVVYNNIMWYALQPQLYKATQGKTGSSK
jgi:hypothetical protein